MYLKLTPVSVKPEKDDWYICIKATGGKEEAYWNGKKWGSYSNSDFTHYLRPVPVSPDVEEAARDYLIPKMFLAFPTIEEEVKEYYDFVETFLAGHTLAAARLADLERENRELKEGMQEIIDKCAEEEGYYIATDLLTKYPIK